MASGEGLVESPTMADLPTVPVQAAQPAAASPEPTRPVRVRRPRRRQAVGFGLLLGLLLAAYFLAPGRTNVLLMGLDRTPPGTDAGRTDTLILLTLEPSPPYVGMLSIPRDLWVVIPGVGENRINTAHVFAELAEPGSGPEAALETLRANFGVPVQYYVRVRFESVVAVVDALGGVEVRLEEPAAGYGPGTHRLDGQAALRFLRDRSGTDDFFRMAHGQAFLRGLFRTMAHPRAWSRLLAFLRETSRSLDTNLPAWLWPRLGLALLRVGPDGLDARLLPREAFQPFTTSAGAQVLLPRWDRIDLLVEEVFGPVERGR